MNTLGILLSIALEVIAVRPQQNPEGKLLTMEEANTKQYTVRPERVRIPAPEQSASPYREVDGSVYCDSLLVAQAYGDISFGTYVSRNEFGINGGLFPSPQMSKCAYYQKDNSAVGTFPILDINTASAYNLKYPYAGTPSEKLKLFIYDKSSGQSIELQCNDFDEERYLTQVSWKGEHQILVQVLDRSQHNMHLNLYNADNGEFVRTILSEHNDAWVEPYEPLHFVNDNLFIYSTDNRDGYKNLYLVDLQGNIKRLLKVDADLDFVGYQDNSLYYYSAELSPADRQLFKVKLSNTKSVKATKVSKPQRLTKENGWHNVVLYEDSFIDVYTAFNNPGWTRKYDLNGKLIESLMECTDPLADYASPEVEFGTVPSADGLYKNHYRLFKPLNFDPSKKYPLIVYVYGGPHSQMVNDSWLGNIRMWEMYMAQRGYIVYVQDNRGTQRHGAAYEKAINRECGQAEMADQMVGIRKLLSEPWVDASRVGVHGWSYGGFMTISLATTYPEVFKVAVAGGPVIDWKWYEIMYGERYMDTPQTNPEGFALTSLLDKADRLQCKLLICQGAIDNVVVWQHSLSFLQKCIDAGKQVDYFPFPKAYHNMMGEERNYLYQKISDYFQDNL